MEGELLYNPDGTLTDINHQIVTWDQLAGQTITLREITWLGGEDMGVAISYDDIKNLSPDSEFLLILPVETVDDCIKNNFNIHIVYNPIYRNLGNLRWILPKYHIKDIPKDQPCRLRVAYSDGIIEELQEFTEIERLIILINDEPFSLTGISEIRCKKLIICCIYGIFDAEDLSINLDEIFKSEYIEELIINPSDIAKVFNCEILENNYTLLKSNIDEIESTLIRNNQYKQASRFAKTKVAI